MDSDKVINKYESLFKDFLENTRNEATEIFKRILAENEKDQIKIDPVSGNKLNNLSSIEIVNKDGKIGVPESQKKNIKVQEVFGPKPWLKFKEILDKNLKKVK